MNQFNVVLPHKPGALADLCEKLTIVNIEAVSSEIKENGNAVMKLITNDETTTRNLLDKNGLEYTENEVITLKLLDQPGTLRKITRKIADAGINLTSLYVTGKKNGNK